MTEPVEFTAFKKKIEKIVDENPYNYKPTIIVELHRYIVEDILKGIVTDKNHIIPIFNAKQFIDTELTRIVISKRETMISRASALVKKALSVTNNQTAGHDLRELFFRHDVVEDKDVKDM